MIAPAVVRVWIALLGTVLLAASAASPAAADTGPLSTGVSYSGTLASAGDGYSRYFVDTTVPTDLELELELMSPLQGCTEVGAVLWGDDTFKLVLASTKSSATEPVTRFSVHLATPGRYTFGIHVPQIYDGGTCVPPEAPSYPVSYRFRIAATPDLVAPAPPVVSREPSARDAPAPANPQEPTFEPSAAARCTPGAPARSPALNWINRALTCTSAASARWIAAARVDGKRIWGNVSRWHTLSASRRFNPGVRVPRDVAARLRAARTSRRTAGLTLFFQFTARTA